MTKLISIGAILFLTTFCSSEKILEINVDPSESQQKEEKDAIGKKTCSIAGCSVGLSTITSEKECESVEGYLWSSTNNACFPEYIMLTSEQECTSRDGFLWSVESSSCFPKFQNISSEDECNSIVGYQWSSENNVCFPEYSTVSSESVCELMEGFSWSELNNSCYPDYQNITSADECNSLEGYMWSETNSACFPKYADISSEEQCLSTDGYSWSEDDNTCFPSYETLSAEEHCNSSDGFVWIVDKCSPRGGLAQNQAGSSCKAILDNGFSYGDGTYWLDPNLGDSSDAFQAYCDMTTDGGGWVLVLNYLHLTGTNPNLNVRSSAPPLLGSDTLGTDESNSSTFWGHASNALFEKLHQGREAGEVRFFCKTSAHTRVVHFKSSFDKIITYFSAGTDNISGLQNSFTAFEDHDAFIPAQANGFFSNKGDLAMTDFPFYRGGNYHWGIKGLNNRWECDDYGGSSFDTLHRVYLR